MCRVIKKIGMISLICILSSSGWSKEVGDTITPEQYLRDAIKHDQERDGSESLNDVFDQYMKNIIDGNGEALNASLGKMLMAHMYQYKKPSLRVYYYERILSVLDQINPVAERDAGEQEQMYKFAQILLNQTIEQVSNIPKQAESIQERFERSTLDYVELLIKFKSADYGNFEVLNMCEKLLGFDYSHYSFRATILRLRLQVLCWTPSRINFNEEYFNSMLRVLPDPLSAEDREDIGFLIMELYGLKAKMSASGDVESATNVADFIDRHKQCQTSILGSFSKDRASTSNDCEILPVVPRFLRAEGEESSRAVASETMRCVEGKGIEVLEGGQWVPLAEAKK